MQHARKVYENFTMSHRLNRLYSQNYHYLFNMYKPVANNDNIDETFPMLQALRKRFYSTRSYDEADTYENVHNDLIVLLFSMIFCS